MLTSNLLENLNEERIYIHDKRIDKHDKIDPFLWWDGNLVDPRIRVNGQVKSIFAVLLK